MSKESRQRARTNEPGLRTGANPGRPSPSAGDAIDATDAGATDAGATAPAAPGPTGAASGASDAGRSRPPTRASTSPTGTPRVGRRSRQRATVKPSFLERYRTLLIAGAAVAVVAVVGVGLFSAASTPAYACSNIWEPTPTSAPGAGTSPQPGYPQPDSGNTHVAIGAQVTYTYCPPATGRHYQAQGAGPIAARLYGPDDTAAPTGWIHNMEHGGIVILYRGDGEGATAAGQAALRALFDSYPPSPVCRLAPGTNGPVIARFDQMATPYAALVWGRVLPLQTLDTAAILEFDATYGEVTNPEQLCEPSSAPTTSPSAGGSTSPSASASAVPSASAAPSASTAPSASPSPS